MKRRVKMFSLLPLMTFAIVLVGLLQPLSVSAARVSGRIRMAYTRLHAGQSDESYLQFHGGPVMAGIANAYAIFWEPRGSFVSANYNGLITQYLGDIGSSRLYHNNRQYTQRNGGAPLGAVFAGSWVDAAAYPDNPISDAQVRREVKRAQQVNGWSSSINTIFFVFTAKGENICSGNQCSFTAFCAYHGFFGTDTIYAAIPYTGTNLRACGVPVSPNQDFDADSTINIISHEQIEAATDPLLDAWYDGSGNEIGDKCDFNFGPIRGFGGDVKLGGNPYEVQQEWDNAERACVLKGP